MRQIAALKAQNKTSIDETQERLNAMQYPVAKVKKDGTQEPPRKATAEEIVVETRKLERLDEERKSLLKREEKVGDESMARYNDLDAFLELSKNASGYWKDASPEKKRILADLIVSNVVVDGNKVASVTLTPQFEEWSKREKTDDGRDERT